MKKKLIKFNLIIGLFFIMVFFIEILYVKDKASKNLEVYTAAFQLKKTNDFCRTLFSSINGLNGIYRDMGNLREFVESEETLLFGNKSVYAKKTASWLYAELETIENHILLTLLDSTKIQIFASKAELESEEMIEFLKEFFTKYHYFSINNLNKQLKNEMKGIDNKINESDILSKQFIGTEKENYINFFEQYAENQIQQNKIIEKRLIRLDLLTDLTCEPNSIKLLEIDPRTLNREIGVKTLIFKYLILIGLFNLIFIIISGRKLRFEW
jgi:hypothetical protein